MSEILPNTKIWQNSQLCYILFLILPFGIFFWFCPFVSDVTIGNDYTLYSIHHQLELMFALKTGTFPLYVPGFEGGRTAFGLITGEMFHPISYLSVLMPGYWAGHALEINTLFRLLFLGCAHFLLFLFLRKINFSLLISLFLSLLTVYNLQMLVWFRGASCESWTGFIILLAGIGLYYVSRTKGWALFIIGATYWLICSGHLPTVYYVLIGVSVFTLLLPYILDSVDLDIAPRFKSKIRFLIHISVLELTGILLSSAFLLPTYFDFFKSCAARIGQDYAWANDYLDTFIGTINNFFYPLESYGSFGGTPLLLVGILYPLVRLFKIQIPWAVWMVLALVLLLFLHIQGDRTPVHYLFWKYLPFAGSIRVPGRIAVMIPMLFLLLFIWVFGNSQVIIIYGYHLKPYAVLAVFAIILTGVYLIMSGQLIEAPYVYSPVAIDDIPGWVKPLTLALGICILVALGLHGTSVSNKRFLEVILCVLSIVQLSCFIYYGTWIEGKPVTPTYEMMLNQKMEQLAYHYPQNPGGGLYHRLILQQLEHTCLEPFKGKVFTDYVMVKDQENAFNRIAHGIRPDLCVIENGKNIDPLSSIHKNGVYNIGDKARLIYSSYNRLVFEVQASEAGFFMLAEPDCGRWKALVNNDKVKIYRANGIYMAVRVPAGISRVEFKYWSHAAFWGIIVSLIGFATIGLWGIHFHFKGPVRFVLNLIVVCVAGVILFVWYHSLYNGKNLNTHYQWEKASSERNNLAYYKHTVTNSLFSRYYPHLYSGSLAVDGQRDIDSGILLDFNSINTNPKLQIDLDKVEKIGSVKIFEGSCIGANLRPLTIAWSKDLDRWQEVKVYTNERPIHVRFAHPVHARFVGIMASGKCWLSLDEVEVYPPE